MSKIVAANVKLAFFYTMMWALIALPISTAAVLRIHVHNRIRHTPTSGASPKHGQNLENVIATDLYYLYEADIWQSKKECVQYDDKLLYKPSSGCRFSNKEFSTSLNFSEAGRSVPLSGSQRFGRPLFFVGDFDHCGLGRERR